jgi:hypothetical protein
MLSMTASSWRLFDREIDVFRAAGGDLRDRLAGRRVDRGESLFRLRRLELAVDERVDGQVQFRGNGLVFGMRE